MSGDGWMGGRVDGCKGGWVDGWVDGGMGGWVDRWGGQGLTDRRSEFSRAAALPRAGLMSAQTSVGWHYLSNASCLIRPHLVSTELLV